MNALDAAFAKYLKDTPLESGNARDDFIFNKVTKKVPEKQIAVSQASLDKQAFLAGRPTQAQIDLQASMPWEPMRASATGLHLWDKQGQPAYQGDPNDLVGKGFHEGAFSGQEANEDPNLLVQRPHPNLPDTNNLLPFARFKNATTNVDFTDAVPRRTGEGSFEEDAFIRAELGRKLQAGAESRPYTPQEYVSQEEPWDPKEHLKFPGDVTYGASREKAWQDIWTYDAEMHYSGDRAGKKPAYGDKPQIEHVVPMGRAREKPNAARVAAGEKPRNRQEWRETDARMNQFEGDMINFRPARAGVNKARSNMALGMLDEDVKSFDQAGKMKIDSKNRIFEPRKEKRGENARITLGMAQLYPDLIELTAKEKKLYKKWSKEQPETKEERLHNKVMEHTQGYGNPMISDMSYSEMAMELHSGDTRYIKSLGAHIKKELIERTPYGTEEPLHWKTKSARNRSWAASEEIRDSGNEKAIFSNQDMGDVSTNLMNKGLYGISTVSSIAVGGLNAILEGADLITDDPEHEKDIRAARKYFNTVNQEISSWVNRSSVSGALENIDPEVKKIVAQFDTARAQLEKGNNTGAAITSLALLGNFLGATAKFVKDDPDAVLDVLAESLPQMWLAAKHLIGGTIVIMARYFNDNVEAFTKEHGGVPPTGDQKKEILFVSGLSAVAEAGSAHIVMKPFMGKLRKAKNKIKEVKDTATAVAKETSKLSKVAIARKALGLPFKATGMAAVGAVKLTGKAIKSLPVKRGIQSTATEGLTELFQTSTEEYAKHLEMSKMSKENITKGGVLGAGSGLTLGTVGGSVEAGRRALGSGVTKLGSSVATAKAKATGAVKQFTTDIASKRDPVRAYDVEESTFKSAKSQKEAFSIIAKMEKHRENLLNQLIDYDSKNGDQIKKEGTAERAKYDEMLAHVEAMDADLETKTVAAKYKTNPEEAVKIDTAYSNLSKPKEDGTEYNSEDVSTVVDNILFGSDDFKGSTEGVDKILANKDIGDDIRKFLIAAKAAAQSLEMYREVKKEGNFADVRNMVAGEQGSLEPESKRHKGARFYAKHMSTAVARRDLDAFNNLALRLENFRRSQARKITALREKIAIAESKNEKYKQEDSQGATRERLDTIGAMQNPIDVLWGTKKNTKDPFVIRGQTGANEDPNLYYTRGAVERTLNPAIQELDVLDKIQGVFDSMPENTFEGGKRHAPEEELSPETAADADKHTKGTSKVTEGPSTRRSTTTPKSEDSQTEVPKTKGEGIDPNDPLDEVDDLPELGSEGRQIPQKTRVEPKDVAITEYGSEGDSPLSNSRTPELDKLPEYVSGQRTMTYAGIGSSRADAKVQADITGIASFMNQRGYTLYSGGAPGVDTAFHTGAGQKFIIFEDGDATDTTREIAREVHPKGRRLSPGVLDKHARNVNEVMGWDLKSPVDFVLVWTHKNPETGIAPEHPKNYFYDKTNRKHPKRTGGVSTAITVAVEKGIPVINMGNPGWKEKFKKALKGELKAHYNKEERAHNRRAKDPHTIGSMENDLKNRDDGTEAGRDDWDPYEDEHAQEYYKALNLSAQDDIGVGDYTYTNLTTFAGMNYMSEDSRTAKGLLIDTITDILKRAQKNSAGYFTVPGPQYRNRNGSPGYLRNIINDLLFDFYTEHGWPNSQEITVFSAAGSRHGDPLQRRFRQHRKTPKSVLGRIPDFMEMTWAAEGITDKINTELDITEDPEIVSGAYEFMQSLYEDFYISLDDVRLSDLDESDPNAQYLSGSTSYAMLTDKYGNLNPNVISAMVVGTMEYMTRATGDSLDRSEGGMTDLLGLPQDTNLDAYDAATITGVRQAGTLLQHAADTVGKGILRQLNIIGKPDISVSAEGHLAASLGLLALDTMVAKGLIEYSGLDPIALARLDSTIDAKGVRSKRGGIGPISEKFYPKNAEAAKPLRFVRITTVPTQYGTVFADQSVWDFVKTTAKFAPVYKKLFNLDLNNAIPSDTVIEKVDTKFQGTEVQMSQYTEKAVEHMQSVAWYIDRTKLDQLKKFPDVEILIDEEGRKYPEVHDYRQEIFGYKDPMNFPITEEAGINNANATLERDWLNLNEYRNSRKDPDAEMYFKYFGVVNNRIHVSNPMVNYHTSKMVRWLLSTESWVKSVDISNFQENNNKDLQEHMIAIVESLGVSAKNNNREQQLKYFYKNVISESGKLRTTYLPRSPKSTKAISKAIAILNSSVSKYSDDEAAAIAAAVTAGGEGVHTFAGLQAIADMTRSLDRGDTTLTVSLAREIDGTTNGVISALMQLVGKNVEKITTAGGVSYDGSNINYSDYAQKHDDNYQAVAKEIFTYRERDIADNVLRADPNHPEHKQFLNNYVEQSNAVISLLGEMGDTAQGLLVTVLSSWREIHKDPLLTLVYGASLMRIVANFQDLAVKRLYRDILTNYQDREKLTEIFQNLQKLGFADLKDDARREYAGNAVRFWVQALLNKHTEARGFELSEVEMDIYKSKVGRFYTNPMQDTLNDYLGDFITMMTAMNNAGDFVNRVFLGHWSMKKDWIRRHNNGREFSKSEEQAFVQDRMKEGLLPGIKSSVSDRTGNDEYSDYIQTTDRKKRGLDEGNVDSKTEISYKKSTTGVQIVDAITGKIDNQKTLSTRTLIRDFTADISVRFFTLINQAMDSSVIQEPLGQFDIQSVFDAFLSGSSSAQEIAAVMNESLKNNHAWTMVEAVSEAVERFLDDYALLSDVEKKIVVEGDGSTIKPMITYEYAGNIVQKAYLFNEKLGIRVNHNPEYILDEFPKAIKEKFLPMLQGYKDKKDANYNKTTGWENFPNEGSKVSGIAKEAKRKKDDADPDSYGSEGDFDSNRNFVPGEKPKKLTSFVAQEVFSNLRNIGNIHDSADHESYLQQALHNMLPVLANMDDFTLHLGTTKKGERHVGSIKGQDIYLGANEGIQRTSSNPSPQEIYIHEMYHGVLRWGIDNDPKMRSETRRLFELAEADPNVTYKAFLRRDADPKDPAEIAEAERKYDYVFKAKGTGYLHEFASFGLSNEAFMNALSKVDTTKSYSIFTGTLPQRLAAVFSYIAATLSQVVNGTFSNNARDSLIELAKNVNGINNASLGKVDEYWGKSWNKVNTVVSQGLKNYMLKPYLKSVVKLSENIQKRKAEGKSTKTFIDKFVILPYVLPKEILYDNFLGSVSEIAYDMGMTMDNVAHHLITEVRGPTIKSKKYHKFLREGKHAIDAATEHKAASITKVLTDTFGRTLTDKEWMDVNAGILKPDLSALIGVHSMQQIRNFLASTGAVNTEMTKIKKLLSQEFPQNDMYYINQAKSLGGFMAIGKDGVGVTMHNAYAIAQMRDLERFGYPVEGDLKRAENLIEQLATLQAIKSTRKDAKISVVKIIDEEFARNVETNGIDLLLKMHDQFKRESLEMLFNNNKSLMIKGWTREMYDEYKSFEVGSLAEENAMNDRGYIRHAKIQPDNNYARTRAQYIYISKDGLVNRRVTGNLGLTGKVGKGHDIISLAYQEITSGQVKPQDPVKLAKLRHENYEKKMMKNLASQFAGEIEMDYDNNWMVPKTNENGKIATYRYTMSEESKINLLGKRDLANSVMGRMFGSLIAKPATQKQNKTVIEYAFEDWKKNYAGDERAFVHIAPNAKKKKHRDLFHLLPSDTHQDLIKTWGTEVDNGFYIREDLMYLIGGFRKASFTEWLDENTGRILPNKMKQIMRLSGIAWEAVIKTGKRNVILFLPEIVTENTYSNTVLLLFKGVPPGYGTRMQKRAVGMLMQHQKDLQSKYRLEALIESDPRHSNTADRELRLDRLKRNIAKNPISKLIDAGLFQSLSEDLATSGTAEYESSLKKAITNAVPALGEMIEGAQAKIPVSWEKAYDFGVFDPKDPMAQAITRATQYSDFMARFALYTWRTEQQKDRIPEGVTEEQWAELAIEEAQDTFVNYDDPTSPEMQWLNDMGVIMFTKFMFRMLRVAAYPFTSAARMEQLNKTADEQIEERLKGQTLGSTVGIKLLEDKLIGHSDIYDSTLGWSKGLTDNMFSPWHHMTNVLKPNSYRFGEGLLEMFAE